MTKAADTAKQNSAFMKPMQHSEHLAKIVGPEPLSRTEVTKKISAQIKSTNCRIQQTNEKSWLMISQSLFSGGEVRDVSDDQGAQ